MKVGDYVRTRYGIKQIYEIDNNKTVWKYKFKLKKQDGDGCIDLGCFSDSDVIKSSPRIIELIQVEDYVNGYKVSFVDEEPVMGKFVQCDYEVSFGTTNHYRFYEADIKSIVTKEQFESMEYKVEE